MKKLATLALLLLAIHFLAVAGGVAYLVSSGRLDKEKAAQISLVLFPPPATQPATQPTTQPVPEKRPLIRLEELLAKQAGRPATEQVEFIRNAFDEQYAQLERRMREMEALQRQIGNARDQLARDRDSLDARQKLLDSRETETARLEKDTGFQQELALYQAMPPIQAKKLFAAMDDELLARYLQAMPTRQASKIMKEFKTPDETVRLQAVMEKIRKSAPTSPLPGSAEPTPGNGSPTPGGAPATPTQGGAPDQNPPASAERGQGTPGPTASGK